MILNMRAKKGTDMMLSMYWFFILFLVTAAVVYMVGLFYGHPYDVRELEADILANSVVDCIIRNGELNSNIISGGIFNENFDSVFLEVCNFNFDSEDSFQGEIQYYGKVDIYSGIGVQNPDFEMKFGNLNIASACVIDSGKDFEALAKCSKKRVYATSSGEQYFVEVTTAVKKGEKNVNV